jgi:hypothetical protein
MEMTLIILGLGESLLILAVLAFLVTLAVMMVRSRKPDPKMQLFVALMKDLPPDKNGPDPSGESGNELDPREEHGPLGPTGFSHIASGHSNPESLERTFATAGSPLREGETPVLRRPFGPMIVPGELTRPTMR